ncbi:unnamed protein product [Caenorhabditis auriculariae]|uniref:Galectin domain-containing protein n=1 Tax=Caenorhabditis auriculariae TaxID=2777116 RepID=A0A8S1GRY6_9PELO|nr:unnamed protein product [Caenorhabditis auriculariae]
MYVHAIDNKVSFHCKGGMLAALWLPLALVASVQASSVLLLPCTHDENGPMTRTQFTDWPKYFVFERPLKHGDYILFSFVFRVDRPADTSIDFRMYDKTVPLEDNLITLHLRFNALEKRLIVNAHETPGVWQNQEQSIAYRDWWLPGRTVKVEVRYHSDMFEIYERTVEGYLLITNFRNLHKKTELLTGTGRLLQIYEFQLICYGDDIKF